MSTMNQDPVDETDQKPEGTKLAPVGAQNPADPKPEGGKHSPDRAEGGASDSDPGHG